MLGLEFMMFLINWLIGLVLKMIVHRLLWMLMLNRDSMMLILVIVALLIGYMRWLCL